MLKVLSCNKELQDYKKPLDFAKISEEKCDYLFFLYSEGVLPVTFLNAVLKAHFE